MNEQLRPDNNEVNCTVEADPPGKVGRQHYFIWESGESNYRVCTTCGRREFNSRVRYGNEVGSNRK